MDQETQVKNEGSCQLTPATCSGAAIRRPQQAKPAKT